MWSRSLWTAFALAGVLQGPSFHTEARLVVLHVTVRDGRGNLVTNLDRDAFSVFENGRRQPLTIFGRDDIPVSVGLLIDNSGSMRTIRAAVEAAALTFAEGSNPNDEMFVINFADKPRLDVPMTSDRAVLEHGIRRVDAIGGTAMRDAVNEAEQYLREHGTRDRRALLIITDGDDNESSLPLDRVLQMAQQRNVAIYAIGLFGHAERSGHAREVLTRLAEGSGGVVSFPETIDTVDGAARDLAHQIRNQYTLGYTPLNQALDGSYRTIQVKVSGRERLYPRTRSGYRAIP